MWLGQDGPHGGRQGGPGLARAEMGLEVGDQQQASSSLQFMRTQQTQGPSLHLWHPQRQTASNLSRTQFDALGASKQHPQESQMSQARFSNQVLQTPPDDTPLGQPQVAGRGLKSNEQSVETSPRWPRRPADGPRMLSKSMERSKKGGHLPGGQREPSSAERRGRAARSMDEQSSGTPKTKEFPRGAGRERHAPGLDVPGAEVAGAPTSRSPGRQGPVGGSPSPPHHLSKDQSRQSVTNLVGGGASQDRPRAKPPSLPSHFSKLIVGSILGGPNVAIDREKSDQEVKSIAVKHSNAAIAGRGMLSPSGLPPFKAARQAAAPASRVQEYNDILKDYASSRQSSVLSESHFAFHSLVGGPTTTAAAKLARGSSPVEMAAQERTSARGSGLPSPYSPPHQAKGAKTQDLMVRDFGELTDRGKKRAANLIKSLSQLQRLRGAEDGTGSPEHSARDRKPGAEVKGLRAVGGFAGRSVRAAAVNMASRQPEVANNEPPAHSHSKPFRGRSTSGDLLRGPNSAQRQPTEGAFPFQGVMDQDAQGTTTNLQQVSARPRLWYPARRTSRSVLTESEAPSPMAADGERDRRRYPRPKAASRADLSPAAIGQATPGENGVEREPDARIPQQVAPGGHNLRRADSRPVSYRSNRSQRSAVAEEAERPGARKRPDGGPSAGMVAPKIDQDSNPGQVEPEHFIKPAVADRDQPELPDEQLVFDDALEQFVEIIRLTTQVAEVNIYSQALAQIYQDVPGRAAVDLTEAQRDGLRRKLEQFSTEVRGRAKEGTRTGEGVHKDAESPGTAHGQKVFYASRYKIPESSVWKQYVADEQLSPWDVILGGSSPVAGREEGQTPSDLPGYHVLLAKIAFSVDKKDFEAYQQHSSRRASLEQQVNNDEEYLIFCCLFQQRAPEYYAEMFMNICQNFLIADDDLRKELEVLLAITRRMGGGTRALAPPPKPTVGAPRQAPSRIPATQTAGGEEQGPRRAGDRPLSQVFVQGSRPKRLETSHSLLESQPRASRPPLGARPSELDGEDDVINEEFSAETVRTMRPDQAAAKPSSVVASTGPGQRSNVRPTEQRSPTAASTARSPKRSSGLGQGGQAVAERNADAREITDGRPQAQASTKPVGGPSPGRGASKGDDGALSLQVAPALTTLPGPVPTLGKQDQTRNQPSYPAGPPSMRSSASNQHGSSLKTKSAPRAGNQSKRAHDRSIERERIGVDPRSIQRKQTAIRSGHLKKKPQERLAARPLSWRKQPPATMAQASRRTNGTNAMSTSKNSSLHPSPRSRGKKSASALGAEKLQPTVAGRGVGHTLRRPAYGQPSTMPVAQGDGLGGRSAQASMVAAGQGGSIASRGSPKEHGLEHGAQPSFVGLAGQPGSDTKGHFLRKSGQTGMAALARQMKDLPGQVDPRALWKSHGLPGGAAPAQSSRRGAGRDQPSQVSSASNAKSFSSTNGPQAIAGSPTKTADAQRETPLSRRYFHNVTKRYAGAGPSSNARPTKRDAGHISKSTSKITGLGPATRAQAVPGLTGSRQVQSGVKRSTAPMLAHELSFQGSLNSARHFASRVHRDNVWQPGQGQTHPTGPSAGPLNREPSGRRTSQQVSETMQPKRTEQMGSNQRLRNPHQPGTTPSLQVDQQRGWAADLEALADYNEGARSPSSGPRRAPGHVLRLPAEAKSRGYASPRRPGQSAAAGSDGSNEMNFSFGDRALAVSSGASPERNGPTPSRFSIITGSQSTKGRGPAAEADSPKTIPPAGARNQENKSKR